MRPSIVFSCAVFALTPAGARAQEPQASDAGSLRRTLEFVGGAATGLALHESGHVAFGLAFHAHPRVKG